MNRPVRAVVFDLDGTLIDSYDAITEALNAARARFGLPPVPRESVRRQVGHGLETLIEHHLGRERVDAGVAVFRSVYPTVMFEGTRPLPGVPDELRRLARAGLAIGVASNKPRRFILPLLQHVGLGETVAAARGPDDDLPPKPEPAMIHAVLDELGAPPDEAIYVGDMPLDAESGRRAGCRTWLVATGSADRAELEAVPCVRIFSDLHELSRSLLEEPELPAVSGRG